MCTVAFIAHLLGYMPEPGTVITVPKHYVSRYTPAYQAKAQRCAAKYGITLKEADEK